MTGTLIAGIRMEAQMASFGERVVGAMQLNPRSFEEVEHDPTAMGQAAGVIALAAVSSAIGNVWYGGFRGIVWSVIASLIGYVVWAAIVWLVGTKVMPDPATKADFPETFRTVGFAAAPGLLGIVTIIPLLGWLVMFLIWVWQIAAMVVAVREVLDYSNTGKAVVVVIIGFIVNLCVTFFIAVLFGGASLLRNI
jgi:Na+/proline symporter